MTNAKKASKLFWLDLTEFKLTTVTVIHCWKDLFFGWQKNGKVWELWQNFL